MRRHADFGVVLATAVATCAVGLHASQAQDAGRGQTARVPARQGTQSAQPATSNAAATPNALAKAQRMANLLKVWEQRSTILKSLDVQIHRIDTDIAAASTVEYFGRAVLKSPDLVWLRLDMVVVDPKTEKPRIDPKTNRPVTVPFRELRCTGTEIWEYKFDDKHIFIYPLDKNQRQRALQEGPLPFLFNMNAALAKDRYAMTLEKEVPAKDNAPGYFMIRVLPLKDIDKESFSWAALQLDARYLLPTRIYLKSPDGQSSEDYQLDRVHPNIEVDDNWFVGKPIRGWQIIRNPGDAPVPKKNARGPREPAR